MGDVMKKISLLLLATLIATPAFAVDYDEDYDTYYEDEQYSEPTITKTNSEKRDTYAGFRIHRNEHIALKYDAPGEHGKTVRSDNFGFGLNVGNRLTDCVKLEFETLYTSASENKYESDFDYDIWSNMLNVYIYKNFGGAVEPYAGVGIGVSGLWIDMNGALGNNKEDNFQLSFAAMAGINFALNKYVDLNLGLRYVDYGKIKHDRTTTHIDATEIYIGAAYKFGIFD